MPEGITNLGKKALQRISLPVFNECRALGSEVVDIAMCAFFLTVCPFLFIRQNFENALKRSGSIEGGIPSIRVASIQRLFHVSIDILPFLIGHERPKWRLNLL